MSSHFERVKTEMCSCVDIRNQKQNSECTGEAVPCEVLEDIVRNAFNASSSIFKTNRNIGKEGNSCDMEKGCTGKKTGKRICEAGESGCEKAGVV